MMRNIVFLGIILEILLIIAAAKVFNFLISKACYSHDDKDNRGASRKRGDKKAENKKEPRNKQGEMYKAIVS